MPVKENMQELINHLNSLKERRTRTIKHEEDSQPLISRQREREKGWREREGMAGWQPVTGLLNEDINQERS